MRTITINNKDIEVRPLSRKIVRELFKDGHVGSGGKDKTVVEHMESQDLVLAKAGFEKKFLDDMAQPDFLNLFNSVMAETFGDEAETKNSERSGKLPETQTAEHTAPPAE